MAFNRFLLAAMAVLSVFDGGNARVLPRHNTHWVDTWVSMPQLVEPGNLPNAPYNETGAVFVNSTIRQTLHMSIGGGPIRLRISNVFGGSELPITAVTVALPFNNSAGNSAIQPNTLKKVTFSGSESYDIPNGALIVSDPIEMTVKPQSVLTVTIYLATGQTTNSITGHPGSRTTSWMVEGNQVSATNITDASRASVTHWYFLSAVEVLAPEDTGAFAIVGDSITDGRGSDTDQNDRWPDLVLKRMQAKSSTSNIAVLNQAAGGNRVLLDSLGPNALGRIDRDVLAQSGVSYAMIFEGVNDIGVATTDVATQTAIGDGLIAAFTQIAYRISAFDIPFFAATITPFSAPGYNVTLQAYSDPEREKTRQRVNKWIRDNDGKLFDAVLDFDKILRNQTVPSQLATALQGGDWLHPNALGYQTLAAAFPLDIFD